MYISVIGAGECDEATARTAYEVGRLVAEAGAILVCGGLGGVMDAAAHGAKDGGGLTVGILPGATCDGASPHLDVVLPTGMGEGRNVLVVRAGDAAIAICGGYGTLNEIGVALRIGKPVVGLDTWQISRGGRKDAGIIEAVTPEEAVKRALELAVHEDSHRAR